MNSQNEVRLSLKVFRGFLSMQHNFEVGVDLGFAVPMIKK